MINFMKQIICYVTFISLLLLIISCSSDDELCSDKIEYFTACMNNTPSVPFDEFPFELQNQLDVQFDSNINTVGFSTTFCDVSDTLNFVLLENSRDTFLIFNLCSQQIGNMVLLNRESEPQEEIRNLFEFEIEFIDFVWELSYNNRSTEFLTGLKHNNNPSCSSQECLYIIDSNFENACSVCF